MRPYLNDVIFTLSRQRQEKVSALLEEARLGKEQLQDLTKRLNASITDFTPLVLAKETPNRGIVVEGIASNVRDIALRIRDLYDASNTISLLLASHESILGSDVKAIEDELLALEKMALNYSFLLSDNQTYNYAFLEPFSDERWRELRDFVPDRGGLVFNAKENAVVQADEGVLALPDEPSANMGLNGEIIKGNANAFIISDTGLDNVVSRSSSGWKVTIAAAAPVITALAEGNGDTGAQVLIEFRLSSPAPISQIKLVPFANMSVNLLQATIFSDANDNSGVDLLTATRVLSRPFTLHFPIQAVARFRLVLNQPTYVRVTQNEKVEELHYRSILDQIKARKRAGFRRIYRSPSHIARLQRLIRKNAFGDISSLGLPNTFLSAYRAPMTPERLLHINKARRPNWDGDIHKRFVVNSLLDQLNTPLKDMNRASGDPILRVQDVSTVLDQSAPTTITTGFNYYYTLGLLYVAVGSQIPSFKGVFVSKPVPSASDIGEIKLKTSEDNYYIAGTTKDSTILTSVEYSISNSPNPASEQDWFPILPIDTNTVVGERFFPDPTGRGYFRFTANVGEIISLYKNGYLMNVLPEYYIRTKDNTGINGINLPQNQVSTADIFTCDYVPLEEVRSISFAARGFNDTPLVSAYDADGAGEAFAATNERNTIDLAHTPYVDPVASQVVGYSPLTVRLDSGVVALNLTNYVTGQTTTMPTDGYYYIQSGNTLMFNVPILESFRVFYQYLQNNVRVRVVLRCNAKDFVSPKVDYFHLKAKTRKADTRRL